MSPKTVVASIIVGASLFASAAAGPVVGSCAPLRHNITADERRQLSNLDRLFGQV